ncbi:MAG: hypothetical protein PHY45_09950 [Rhodocyclaceae bacterium]|nr:hypothetical protein [Rhodocyclaceae bacterium]
MRDFDKQSLLVAAVIMVAGCAETPPAQPPKIARLSSADLEARIPAPVATVSIDDIVAMARRGESAATIAGKIDASRSRYRLGAAQIAAALGQGVPAPVIDHILENERRSLLDDMAADIARRDQACQERIEQEVRQCRLQLLLQPDFATCWPPHAGLPYWRCF